MIKQGDRVGIVWDRGKSISIVTIVHEPSGAGDLWQVETDDGHIFAINPYSPDFIRFERMKSKSEQ